MCSIYGYLGEGIPDGSLFFGIANKAKDRGRDGGRYEVYQLEDGRTAILGNWRAAPTTELQVGPLQPYDGLVHNGTISNDKELGGKDGEIDSQVLARVLDRTSLETLVSSLSQIKGSYALACHNDKTVYLACNYKPIHYWSPDNGKSVYFSSLARHFDGLLPRAQCPKQLSPYSALDLSAWASLATPMVDAKRALVVCSAGLDSTTAAYLLKSQGWEVGLLHFTYGCHATTREADRVKKIAGHLDCPVHFLPIDYSRMKGVSPILTEGAEIAGCIEGAEYAHEWVPARNLVFFSHAVAFAEANGYHAVALGNNQEECMLDVKENRVRMADRTLKMPSEIKEGDELLSYNHEKNILEKTKVFKKYERGSVVHYKLEFAGREFRNRRQERVCLYLTGEHPVYVKNKGYTKVVDMEVGDVVMQMGGIVQSGLQRNPDTYTGPFSKGSHTGDKNPMYGHVRSETEICWCGKNHYVNTEKIQKSIAKLCEKESYREKISKGVRKYLDNQTEEQATHQAKRTKEGITKAMIRYQEETGFKHWSSTPEARKRASETTSRLIAEGIINPAATKERPTECEKRFIAFFEEMQLPMRYVGDGQIWITSAGKHMNPDFINMEKRLIIEVTTDGYPYHTDEEAWQRKARYQKVGWRMLYIHDNLLFASEKVATREWIKQELGGLKNGLKLVKKEKICEKQKVYNVLCYPNNNYFISSSSILTHNSGSFPDNEEQMYILLNQAAPYFVQNGYKMDVLLPVGHLMKHEIVKTGLGVNVPFELTWSCYKAGERHCGQCGPCWMRKTAFERNGAKDPVFME